MSNITVVTGNANKLKELQAVFPSHVSLHSTDIDLPEIQSIDPEEIVRDKLERAFATLKQPVIVEDVSAELACLNGLPGPFIKYFEQSLGKGALWQLAQHHENRNATIRCTMGYYEGRQMTLVQGVVTGSVVEPRGTDGWGFDFVFIAKGQSKTNAELGSAIKNKLSHRARAVDKLVAALFPA